MTTNHRETARELRQEAFVLAQGAIRQTDAMRKQGGSDEEITLLCDLLKQFDRLLKSELSEHLDERITTALTNLETNALARGRAEAKAEDAERVKALLTPYHGVPDPQVSAYDNAISKVLAIIEGSGK